MPEMFGMTETDERALHLMGEIAAVVERDGCTYDEATLALKILLRHYQAEARFFLNGASIMDVAQYRQRQFEKKAAAPGDGAAAGG